MLVLDSFLQKNEPFNQITTEIIPFDEQKNISS